ncbi:peptidase domain-containing ABC transporter [Paenibacillus agri]|uniref:Peptidase domain-containing ABC transporter n=1 Tax=Paenibacillus agri TaxID=2744309 RepID=A0A850ED35_9BACL|nr:peptidase domain-containing ABC transporter [Paenibacillus agri]NUU59115.1 peptidase domain-containing ABC transporter [Paenibacillus agri]
MRRRVPFIEQMEDAECGIACMAMVLAYYRCSVSLHEIRERFGLSRGGSSLLQLISIGSGYSMKSKGFKADFDQLQGLPLPAIAHWEEKHFVVIERIGKRSVTIVDPSFGRKRIPRKEAESLYSGYILCLAPEESLERRKGKNKWSFFVKLALQQPKWLLYILIVSLVLQSFGLVAPQLTAYIADHLLLDSSQDKMSIIGVALLSLFIFYELFSMLRGWFLAKLQSAMDMLMMETFIGKLFRLPYSFFESRTGGELLFRTNANVYIRQILSNRMVSIIIDFILLVSYAALMLTTSAALGSMVIGVGVGIFTILIVTTMITQQFASREITQQSRTQSFLAECIYGITDIKLLGAEKQLYGSWARLFRDQLSTTQKRSIWISLLDSFSSGIQFILPLLLLWTGSRAVVQGTITLGGLLGFNALAAAFMIPIVSLGSAYTQLLSVGSYLQRIHDVVEAKAEQEEGHEEITELKGEIMMNNVSYRYSAFSSDVLQNVNLSIKRGEKLAIVGPSGSGKSTLAKLLLGLYRSTEGEILYDGQSIGQLEFSSLRRCIGAVLQETKLFQRTVEDNIRMLDESIPLERVVEAAKMASIHDDILKLPLGYATIVSENGASLSGGQRQRLLLARALVNQPQVLLLDEATSALDNLSQTEIDSALSAMNCTRIIIAHRLSTVINADRIIVMKEGRIVETGMHHQLLAQKGLYYQLYTGEENKEHEIAI